MRIISDNHRWYRKATVVLETRSVASTYAIPDLFESVITDIQGYRVLNRYNTIKDAMEGHKHLKEMYNLK